MLNELFGTVSAKIAAAVFGLTTAGTSVAAASGNLPGDLQDQAAAVAENLGVDLPDSAEELTAEDVRQDGEHRQDGEGPETADEGTRPDNADDVLSTLSGDAETTPEDGAAFGEAVSGNASENGEEFGRSVATTASDGASDEGEATSTTSSDADSNAAEESTVSDEYRPEEPPADAPSDSGDEFGESGSDRGTGNPGDEHRPE